MKISNWFSRDDERFLSMLQDRNKRQKLLISLRRTRILFFFLFMFSLIPFFLAVIAHGPEGIPAFAALSCIFQYLNADWHIKTIKLYELTSNS